MIKLKIYNIDIRIRDYRDMAVSLACAVVLEGMFYGSGSIL